MIARVARRWWFAVVLAGCGRIDFGSDARSVPDGAAAGDPSLVLALAFDEGAGLVAADSSRYHNDAALFGATFVAAKHGTGLAFTGDLQFAKIANSPSLDITGTALTVSCWVEFDGNDAFDDVLLGKVWQEGIHTTPAYQFGIEFDDNGADQALFYFGDSADMDNIALVAPPLTTLTYLAFTYDGTFVNGYVDGVLMASPTLSGALVARGQPLYLGADTTHAQQFIGLLDDLRIYDRVLTPAEIAVDMMTPVR
jgi:hypothetical protein